MRRQAFYCIVFLGASGALPEARAEARAVSPGAATDRISADRIAADRLAETRPVADRIATNRTSKDRIAANRQPVATVPAAGKPAAPKAASQTNLQADSRTKGRGQTVSESAAAPGAGQEANQKAPTAGPPPEGPPPVSPLSAGPPTAEPPPSKSKKRRGGLSSKSPSGPWLNIQPEIQEELRALVNEAAKLHAALLSRDQNENSLQRQIETVQAQIRMIYIRLPLEKRYQVREHAFRLLSGIEERLEGLKSRSMPESGKKRLFGDMAHLARVYRVKTDDDSVFYCPADRSSWLQSGNRPRNPVSSHLKHCGTKVW